MMLKGMFFIGKVFKWPPLCLRHSVQCVQCIALAFSVASAVTVIKLFTSCGLAAAPAFSEREISTQRTAMGASTRVRRDGIYVA